MYTSDCIEVKVIFIVVKQLWAFFVTALASALAPDLPVLFHNWHMITSFCSLSAVQIYDSSSQATLYLEDLFMYSNHQ